MHEVCGLGKTCSRGVAQFEVGELLGSKLFAEAKSLACTLDAVVHETKAFLVTRSGHYNLQLAIACKSQATTKISTCNHWLAANPNHTARRRRNKQP